MNIKIASRKNTLSMSPPVRLECWASNHAKFHPPSINTTCWSDQDYANASTQLWTVEVGYPVDKPCNEHPFYAWLTDNYVKYDTNKERATRWLVDEFGYTESDVIDTESINVMACVLTMYTSANTSTVDWVDQFDFIDELNG